MSRPKSPPPGKVPGEPEGVTLLQVIGSVLASFFGVQSSRNRERDFKQGNPGVFIAVGVVATLAFVLLLLLVVKLVLRHAGM